MRDIYFFERVERQLRGIKIKCVWRRKIEVNKLYFWSCYDPHILRAMGHGTEATF